MYPLNLSLMVTRNDSHMTLLARNSQQVSKSLDTLGYSTDKVEERIRNMRKLSKAKSLCVGTLLDGKNIERLHVGSMGDGTALLHESDMDILQVDLAVMCREQGDNIDISQPIIFNLDQEGTPPGYAFLCLADESRNQADISLLADALVQHNNKTYLSSSEYLHSTKNIFNHTDWYLGNKTVSHPTKGPSKPCTTTDAFRDWWFGRSGIHLNNEMDFVPGLPCTCPRLLQTWCSRSRRHDWPSLELIQQVGAATSHMVPVGKKDSQNEHLQWRISFTTAEMLLVQSFNDTQRKVHILLRHFAKNILKPICADITSYIIKNVMFWMAENTPQHEYQPLLLQDRFDDALAFLSSRISCRSLQNYMVLERNLLQDKISIDEQKSLLQAILQTERILDAFTLRQIIDIPYIELCYQLDGVSQRVTDLLEEEEMVCYLSKIVHSRSALWLQLHHTRHVVLPYLRANWISLVRGFLRSLMFQPSQHNNRHRTSHEFAYVMSTRQNSLNTIHFCSICMIHVTILCTMIFNLFDYLTI